MNWILLVAFGAFVFNCVYAEHPGVRVILTSKALDYGNYMQYVYYVHIAKYIHSYMHVHC